MAAMKAGSDTLKQPKYSMCSMTVKTQTTVKPSNGKCLIKIHKGWITVRKGLVYEKRKVLREDEYSAVLILFVSISCSKRPNPAFFQFVFFSFFSFLKISL